MFRIDNLDDAKIIWEAFNKKFSIENPDLKHDEEKEQKRKKYYSKPSDDERKEIAKDLEKKFDKKDAEKVKIIQRLWRRKRLFTNESEITVNPKGNHGRDFLHLLGKYAATEDQKKDKKRSEDKKESGKIIRLIHKNKLNRLKEAIQVGNWDAKILAPTTHTPDEQTNKKFKKGSKEYELSMLTLSLFASQDITQQQAYTLLEYSQTIKEYKLGKVYKILDDDGNFTQEACDIFLESLKKRRYFHQFSPEKLKALKFLIQALPKSEQIFYTTDPKKFNVEFTRTLLNLDSVHATKSKLVHFPSGIHDALGLVQFGFNVDLCDAKSERRRSLDSCLYLDGFTRCMPTIGPKTISHIEHGTLNDIRYGALNYPQTIPYEKIHDFSENETDDFNALAHDRYHSTVMSLQSMTPDKEGRRRGMRLACRKIIDLIRAITKIQNSKETWHFVDANFSLLLHGNKIINNNNMDNFKRAEIFSDAILYSSDQESIGSFLLEINMKPRKKFKERLTEAKASPSFLTVIGALVLVDMVSNQDKWMEMGVDPKGLTGGLLKYFEDADLIYKAHLEGRNDLIKILKLQLYINLKKSEKSFCFEEISKLIDKNKDFILKKLSFKKITKSNASSSNQINSIALFYQNDIIPNSPSNNFPSFQQKLLNDIYRHNHPNKDQFLVHDFSRNLFKSNTKAQVNLYVTRCQEGINPNAAGFSVKSRIQRWYNSLKPWQKKLFCFGVPIGISVLLFVIGTGIGAAILGLSTVLAILGGIATGTSFVGISSAGAITAGAVIDTAVAGSLIASSTAIHLSLNSVPDDGENDLKHNDERSSSSSDVPRVENPIKAQDRHISENYELRNGM